MAFLARATQDTNNQSLALVHFLRPEELDSKNVLFPLVMTGKSAAGDSEKVGVKNAGSARRCLSVLPARVRISPQLAKMTCFAFAEEEHGKG